MNTDDIDDYINSHIWLPTGWLCPDCGAKSFVSENDNGEPIIDMKHEKNCPLYKRFFGTQDG